MTDRAPDSDTSGQPSASERLDSWKEIAGYLRRDESTVRRWEKSEGLPVHRHVHEQRASVFAYRHELEAWLESRGEVEPGYKAGHGDLAADPMEGAPVHRFLLPVSAGALALIAVVAWLAWGPGVRPSPVSLAEPYRVLIADPVSLLSERAAGGLGSGAVRDALERELVDASGVEVVAREVIADTLRLMRRPPAASIDGAVAREIGQRHGGIDALLEWNLEQRAETRQMVLLLRDLEGGLIASWEEAAPADIGRAAVRIGRRAAADLRGVFESVGPRSERTVPFLAMEGLRLEDATTASFEAWRLYAEAMTLHFAFRWRQSVELLERAVGEDPEFALAYAFLGRAQTSLGESDQAKTNFARAFELADTVTDRERYFIHAAYYEHVLEDTARTADAYSTLLVTYPGHYWGVNYASWFHFRHGGLPRVTEYLTRYADARPRHLEMTVRAAQALGAWGDSPQWAERYVDRARSLLPEPLDELLAGPTLADRIGTGNTAWLALRDVYAHWQAAEVARALEALQLLEVRADARFAGWLGRAYLVLGRLDDAERMFSRLPLHDARRDEGLVGLALARGGDGPDLRRYLGDLRGRSGSWILVLRARANLYSFDERYVAGNDAPGASVLRGAIALRAGRVDEAIGLLEAALPRLREGAEEVYYLALESLALAWQQAGEPSRAAETLEVTRAMRARAAYGAHFRPLFWLRAQAKLVDLYRALGRDEDAEALESEISALLAVADPDHSLRVRTNHE